MLYDEVLNAFKDIDQGYIIDCTLGYGGHSLGLLEQNHNINLICNDQDIQALDFSKQRLEKFNNRIIYHKANFKDVIKEFYNFDIKGILADIGVSSLQLDNDDRGFGFDSDILDMRMDQSNNLDANIVINTYSTNELENILKNYGEVREYKKVANLIVQNRPFHSAKELARLLSQKLHKGKIHPATLVFQAIRIEVNQELEVLKELFQSIEELKPKGAIVAIISFHTLEDRITKEYFKRWSQNCICPKDIMRCSCGNNNTLGKIITKKPIIPTNNEIKQNKRSRSAKLRIFRFD